MRNMNCGLQSVSWLRIYAMVFPSLWYVDCTCVCLIERKEIRCYGGGVFVYKKVRINDSFAVLDVVLVKSMTIQETCLALMFDYKRETQPPNSCPKKKRPTYLKFFYE